MATLNNKSVLKSFRLLNSLRDHPEGLSLHQAAASAGLAIATAHRFLRTLESVEAVRTTLDGRYLLGANLIIFGQQAAYQAEAHNALKRHVQECAKLTGETVHVCVQSGSRVRYVAKSSGRDDFSINTQVGTELEAYCTGVGKLLLAFGEQATTDHCFRRGAPVKLTPNTIVDRDDLRQELARVRRNGVAFDNEEFKPGLKCVAVPIFGRRSDVVASLSVSGRRSDLECHSTERLIGQLRHTSSRISRSIGPEDWARLTRPNAS